jgi:hypothetical protein
MKRVYSKPTLVKSQMSLQAIAAANMGFSGRDPRA